MAQPTALKTKSPKAKQKTTSNRVNLSIGTILLKRASDYSEKSGISITSLLRNGLDLLLKQNNF